MQVQHLFANPLTRDKVFCRWPSRGFACAQWPQVVASLWMDGLRTIHIGSADDTRQVAQQRVAVLARLWTLIACGGTLFQMAGDIVQSHPERLLRGANLLFGVAAVAMGTLWFQCRHRVLPLRGIYAREAIALLVFGMAMVQGSRDLVPDIIGMAPGIPLEELSAAAAQGVTGLAWNFTGLTMAFAFTLVLATHAALVPSTPGHVMLLSTVLFLPLTAILGHSAGPSSSAVMTSAQRLSTLINSAVWWTLAATNSVTINRVVHALRREVAAARKLGQYTLEERLGSGGMGVVYRAQHGMMRRPTAIKLLSTRASTQAMQRFEREVQLTARLTHPHTITVFDYGRTPEGTFYYAMELLEGPTLQEVVDLDGPQPEARVLHVLIAVAGALVEAHEQGLVHRDIKPANILLARYSGQFDFPKLLDFGLVQDTGDTEPTTAAPLAGTPLYMAPELVRSTAQVDGRADIYALGAVGYFALTGAPVFTAASIMEVLGKHAFSQPQRPSERTDRPISPTLEALILACLEKDPSARPSSARELLKRLVACAGDKQWSQDEAQHWWDERFPAVLRARENKSVHVS